MQIHFPSGAVIGAGRVALLEGILRYGSITAAARSVGLTYRQTWNTVQILNTTFAEPLIAVSEKGRCGGTQLTPTGQKVLGQFREMECLVEKTLRRPLRAIEKTLGEKSDRSPAAPRWVLVEGKSQKKRTKPDVGNRSSSRTDRSKAPGRSTPTGKELARRSRDGEGRVRS
jgi:molybdate transport system regulatory protein